MTHSIHFISLGPGDPELITRKGERLLREAEIIFYPATQTSEGLTSRALEILRALEIDNGKTRPFFLPMRKERTAAWQAYDKLCEKVRQAYTADKKVAIVAEGDAGFYASIQYAFDKLRTEGFPVVRVAGIPAFIAAGSLAGLHIASQEERLQVFPGNASFAELKQGIETGDSLVIMKLSACRDALREAIQKLSRQARFHYFENVSTMSERYLSDPEKILKQTFPYFSLMIIQPNS